MLQGSMVFHEACLYVYLRSDRVVPGPGRGLYEKLKEWKNRVIEQERDGVVCWRKGQRGWKREGGGGARGWGDG
jgi:hypothetical protein